jgi:hypothetical protein
MVLNALIVFVFGCYLIAHYYTMGERLRADAKNSGKLPAARGRKREPEKSKNQIMLIRGKKKECT